MKQLVAFALCTAGSLVCAQAQQAGAEADPLAGKGAPTASPNRIASSALAKGKHGKADPNRLANAHFAPMFVDSQGVAMGRAFGTNAFLTTYGGESLVVSGLTTNSSTCDYATRQCANAAGVNWSRNYASLMYAEANCTGQPYLSYPGSVPATLLGMPILDQGAWYLYLVRPAETVWFPYRSYYSSWGGCYNSYYYDQATFAAPLVDTVPASDVGTPPFLLK